MKIPHLSLHRLLELSSELRASEKQPLHQGIFPIADFPMENIHFRGITPG